MSPLNRCGSAQAIQYRGGRCGGVDTLRNNLKSYTQGMDTIAEVNVAMRECFTHVVVIPPKDAIGELWFSWRHGPPPSVIGF